MSDEVPENNREVPDRVRMIAAPRLSEANALNPGDTKAGADLMPASYGMKLLQSGTHPGVVGSASGVNPMSGVIKNPPQWAGVLVWWLGEG